MSRNETVIDAAGTADEAERRRLEAGADDRGEPMLGDSRRRSTPGAKAFFAIVLVLGSIICAFLIWQAFKSKSGDEADAAKKEQEQSLANTMPDLKQPNLDNPPPAPATAPETAEPIVPEPTGEPPPTTQTSNTGQPPPKPAWMVLRDQRLGSSLRGEGTPQGDATAPPAPLVAGGLPPGAVGGPAPPQPGSGLADLLTPVALSAARAGTTGSRDLLMLRGTMADCVLNTRIVSSLPGMVACDLTRDVYSANGRTVLLDRGTRVTGSYERGLFKGQARIFVAWARAVTPQGVVINLDSPGTDQLGASGHEGKVNYHFWQRFGSAILLSVIDDVAEYVLAREQAKGGDQITFGNTGQAGNETAGIALRDSVNIPPTLTKAHGERINIFVARDLDFSSVYELRRKH